MIVVDTSIWIDHLRRADPRLGDTMTHKQTFMHPFVIAEIALGSISQRQSIVSMLKGNIKPQLPRMTRFST